MTGRVTVIRAEVGRHHVLLRGPGGVLVPALKAVRCSRRWDDERHGWSVPVDSYSDIVAALDDGFGGVEIDARLVDR